MYDEKNKSANSQTNGSIKYVSNKHESVMLNEIYCKLIMIMIDMYFRVCFKILIDERVRGIDNCNH